MTSCIRGLAIRARALAAEQTWREASVPVVVAGAVHSII